MIHFTSNIRTQFQYIVEILILILTYTKNNFDIIFCHIRFLPSAHQNSPLSDQNSSSSVCCTAIRQNWRCSISFSYSPGTSRGSLSTSVFAPYTVPRLQIIQTNEFKLLYLYGIYSNFPGRVCPVLPLFPPPSCCRSAILCSFSKRRMALSTNLPAHPLCFPLLFAFFFASSLFR